MSIELHQESNQYKKTLSALFAQEEVFNAEIHYPQDGEPPVFIFKWPISVSISACMGEAYRFYQHLSRSYKKPRNITIPDKYPYLALDFSNEISGYGEIKRKGNHIMVPFNINELDSQAQSEIAKIINKERSAIEWVSIETPFFSACFDGNIPFGQIRTAVLAGRENLAKEMWAVRGTTSSLLIQNVDRNRIEAGLKNLWSDLPYLEKP